MISVNVFRESVGDRTAWIAKSKEPEVCAQGDTEELAKASFLRTLTAHILLNERALQKMCTFTKGPNEHD
jgi:hypothetical protein